VHVVLGAAVAFGVLAHALDCTSGFYVTPEWRAVAPAALLDRAGATGDHVRVISHIGLIAAHESGSPAHPAGT
jgi:hypothetical protein